MGMSASQARLIALTARMSDTEYEAQQINQQRLTLANKMNEIQEQAVNMPVPTPPSKIDFAVEAYSGKVGKQPVNVRMNDDGSYTATKTQNGWSANMGSERVSNPDENNPAQYIDTSKSYEKSDFEKYDVNNYREIVTKDDHVSTPWSAAEGWDNDDTEYVKGTYTETINHTLTNATEKPTAPEGSTYDFSGVTSEDKNGTTYYSGTYVETKTVQVPEGTKRTDLPEGTQFNLTNVSTDYCVGSKKVSEFHDGKNYISTKGDEDIDGTTANEHNRTADQLANKKFVVDNGDGTYDLKNVSDIADGDKVFVCTNETAFAEAREIQKNSNGDVLVGGKRTMDYSEAEKQFGQLDSFKNAITGLRNLFESQGKQLDTSKISVIIGSDGKSYSFCYTEELSNPGKNGTVTTFTPYEGDVEIVDPNATLQYDSNGNVSGVTFTDPNTGKAQSAKLSSNDTAYDEIAYDAAMRQYDRDKIEYDREQNELNKKTSVYQRQDKQLELKLTRLDNERNALNTEIEAVKKVIQDAIDRGFKTFSG